ncbi:acyl carrier protein [Ferrovum myxofaciens]|jgi:acyl carrier protein|nr:acyl carrier protein [Ferrovum myxofaciens]
MQQVDFGEIPVMSTENSLRDLLDQVLQLGPRVSSFHAETPLLGSIPELDSMAVVNLITTLEEHFGFTIDDDEINAEVFGTLGTLTAFVDHKLHP